MSRSKATAVPMMGIGCTGARDMDDTRASVYDSQSCSNSNMGVVATAGCASNMTTESRWTISMLITTIRALPICKRCMDTATMRKRGSIGTISRAVCVTSIGILRSGVRRKSHAPFWSSGRRSDPPIDCNRLNLTIRQHVAAVGRRVSTLCKHEAGVRQQLAVYLVYHHLSVPHVRRPPRLPFPPSSHLFCLPHPTPPQPLSQPLPTHGHGSAKTWQPRTPAMAAGLTDHVWTLREVLLVRGPPWPQPAGVW